MGVFTDRKICPICQKNNEIYITGGGDPASGGGNIWLEIKCKHCGYQFSFGYLSFVIFLGCIIVIAILWIEFANGQKYGGITQFMYYIFSMIAMMSIMLILFLLFIRFSIFDDYINRHIIKKAHLMIDKNRTSMTWNNEILNRQTLEELAVKLNYRRSN